MKQVHRVKRGPDAPTVPLPRDTWQGGSFIEGGTGDVLETVWNGDKRAGYLCAAIERGDPKGRINGRTHTRRP